MIRDREFIYEVFEQMSKFEKNTQDRLVEMGAKRTLFSTLDFKKRSLEEFLRRDSKEDCEESTIVTITWVAQMAYKCGLMDGKGYEACLNEAIEEYVKAKEETGE